MTSTPESIPRRGLQRALVVVQVALVVSVLAVWFGVDAVRESRSLWVLLAYCLPSEFLVATVPHEPVMLYFAKFYDPLTIALVSALGTVVTEALNYSVFGFVVDTKLGVRLKDGALAQRLVGLFDKAPFFALIVAGLTPVPFYPFRFLVVLARYPIGKYLAAVAVSRTPRFYLIALFGGAVNIPDGLLIGLFAVLIIAANGPLVVRRLRRGKRGPETAIPDETVS